MYFNNDKKEKIVDLFSTYALWSDSKNSGKENHSYAIKRQARCIVELIELGIPHYLEQWATDVLADPFYAEAEYTAEES
tara:strand:- start:500 stop:736 length:237 start_codon:yes stop_codon:yes gene_type:complete